MNPTRDAPFECIYMYVCVGVFWGEIQNPSNKQPNVKCLKTLFFVLLLLLLLLNVMKKRKKNVFSAAYIWVKGIILLLLLFYYQYKYFLKPTDDSLSFSFTHSDIHAHVCDACNRRKGSTNKECWFLKYFRCISCMWQSETINS